MLKLIRLDINSCKQITNTDLPYFAHVKYLNISSCDKITDISVLKGVYNSDRNL